MPLIHVAPKKKILDESGWHIAQRSHVLQGLSFLGEHIQALG